MTKLNGFWGLDVINVINYDPVGDDDVQLRPAVPEVKGPRNFICYWRIFVIANIENEKKWLEGTKV